LKDNTIANPITNRLIAIWAFSECGLGGLMHALKFPFTGIFIGGMAVILIALMSFFIQSFNQKKTTFYIILQATILVLIVKALVSPQSPIGAYFAVAFQGILGALIFQFCPYRIAVWLFSIISMAESAVQKVIILTILFGQSLWTALDKLVISVLSDLKLGSFENFSYWIIAIYLIIYIFWGVALAIFIIQIPKQIELHKDHILLQYQNYRNDLIKPTLKENQNNYLKIIFIATTIAFAMMAYFLFPHGLMVLLRAVIIILITFFVIQPLIVFILKYLFKHKTSTSFKSTIYDLLNQLPELKEQAYVAFYLAKEGFSGIWLLKRFIINWIVIQLYSKA
jgi:hypothetical protein